MSCHLRCEHCGASLTEADLLDGMYSDGHLLTLGHEEALRWGTPYLPCGPVVPAETEGSAP